MQIDHDPREKPRSTKGETIFVTVATIVVLVALGTSLKLAFEHLGYGVGMLICAVIVILAFALAFWLDRRK